MTLSLDPIRPPLPFEVADTFLPVDFRGTAATSSLQRVGRDAMQETYARFMSHTICTTYCLSGLWNESGAGWLNANSQCAYEDDLE